MYAGAMGPYTDGGRCERRSGRRRLEFSPVARIESSVRNHGGVREVECRALLQNFPPDNGAK